MLRLVLSVILHFPYCIAFYFRMRKGIKKKTDFQERYDIGRSVILTINKKSKITTITYGKENIPEENGYIFYPSHQGKYDGLAMVTSSEKQFRFVIDDKRSHISIEGTFMDLINAKRIDKTNPKKTLIQFREVADEVSSGINYCIFPEGGHNNNKNNLQEFYTGCFRFLHKIKCPIIPVCLYDTYKVYNVNSYRKVTCEVHILKPISYEEYKDLDTKEIAVLVKTKIQEKLDEIKESKGEIDNKETKD